METVRELMIQHGASIRYVDGICTIRLNADYPYKTLIDKVLCRLRALIYSSQYLSIILKYQ